MGRFTDEDLYDFEKEKREEYHTSNILVTKEDIEKLCPHSTIKETTEEEFDSYLLSNFYKNSQEDLVTRKDLVSYFSKYLVNKFKEDLPIVEEKNLTIVEKDRMSLGAILRSELPVINNKPLISEFIKDKGTPIILGVSDDQIPYMIDLEQETSINIVGGSGTGKSWLAYNIMFNLMISNTPDDLKAIVFDAKNSPIWNQIALAPHVIGYHSEVDKYAEQLLEVTKELARRQEILKLKEIEDWSTLREGLRDEGNYEELVNYPNLVVVMEELNYVTKVLLNKEDTSEYYSLVNSLEKISQCGRSVGVHLITFVQHPKESVLSSTLIANASVTIGLMLNATKGYDTIFGKDNLEGVQFPRDRGIGLIQFDDKVVRPIKLLTLGTITQTSMKKLIRVLSLDWVNRNLQQDVYSHGLEYIKQTELVESVNQNKYSKIAKDALETDYILFGRALSPAEYTDYSLKRTDITDF